VQQEISAPTAVERQRRRLQPEGSLETQSMKDMSPQPRRGALRRLTGLVLAPMLALALPAVAQAQSDSLDLAQYRGKVVYVDFWASWCGPCKVSFRYMAQLRAIYPAKDLAIVTINLDHDRAAAAGFLKAVGSTLPVVYDPKGALAAQYKVQAMPTTVLIGRDGKQRFVHQGYFEAKNGEYSQHVAALVAEHP